MIKQPECRASPTYPDALWLYSRCQRSTPGAFFTAWDLLFRLLLHDSLIQRNPTSNYSPSLYESCTPHQWKTWIDALGHFITRWSEVFSNLFARLKCFQCIFSLQKANCWPFLKVFFCELSIFNYQNKVRGNVKYTRFYLSLPKKVIKRLNGGLVMGKVAVFWAFLLWKWNTGIGCWKN